MQQQISTEVIRVSEENLAAVLRNFRRRLHMVLGADGAYIENVFTRLSISQDY
jgi:hypothetical protein